MHPIDDLGVPLSNALLVILLGWLVWTVGWHLFHTWQAKRWADDLESQKVFSDYLEALHRKQ